MTALTNAGIFLMGLLFDLYIIILMLRLLLQKLGAKYYNPVSQMIIKMTNVVVSPLKRIIPGYRGFDFSIVFLLILFEMVEALLLLWLQYRVVPRFEGVLLIAFGALGNKLMNLYFYAIILRVVMSWVTTLQQSPVAEIVYLLTEPLMQRARRIIPLIAGLDLSPIPVLILLQLISILVFNPIIDVGMRFALAG